MTRVPKVWVALPLLRLVKWNLHPCGLQENCFFFFLNGLSRRRKPGADSLMLSSSDGNERLDFETLFLRED